MKVSYKHRHQRARSMAVLAVARIASVHTFRTDRIFIRLATSHTHTHLSNDRDTLMYTYTEDPPWR